MAMKMYACELHVAGDPNYKIIDKVFDKFEGQLKEKPPISTVSTWYNTKNLELYKTKDKSSDNSQRKRHFFSRKEKPVAKANPVV